ncbi:MAG TPA: Trp biosynthesis-associated membrane protein, partial [Jatrophihabitans sp.]|nr:Trp biosynthesis-associated membrane protein [Jatrophihabitans sp.]
MTPPTLAVSGRAAQRREMAAALGLAALAGLAILFTTSRSWLVVTIGRRPPFGPLRVELTGREQYPALAGLAVVALLGVVLVLVTGGIVRRVLGGLLVLAGGWACGYAAGGLGSPGPARLAELLGNRLAQSSGPLQLDRHPAWAA